MNNKDKISYFMIFSFVKVQKFNCCKILKCTLNTLRINTE